MGIKLPNQSLNSEFECVLLLDDALDIEDSEFDDKIRRYNDGVCPCPVKEGMDPVVWTLRPLPGRLSAKLKSVLRKEGEDAFFYEYGLYSLRDVENLDIEIDFSNDSKGYEHIDANTEKLLGEKILVELGGRAFMRTLPNFQQASAKDSR